MLSLTLRSNLEAKPSNAAWFGCADRDQSRHQGVCLPESLLGSALDRVFANQPEILSPV
jgi:hypothetical protein